jgi:hypothetical protein
MKCLASICILITIPLAYSEQATALDLTKDNPKTLIGTNSKDYSIYDFRLGLTHEQAWQAINKNSLIGEKSEYHPDNIEVYNRNSDGSKGKSVLKLMWASGIAKMNGIVVYQDFRTSLSPNFRRLMTFEAIDDDSAFKKEFIGYENKMETPPGVNGSFTKIHFYDDIGLKVYYHHGALDGYGDSVNFSISQSNP